ncbi:hypothetical protein QM894_05885 [Streptococcus cristatus]|uniref:hypothetical protein n=1 Tax=Streptococcus TaxID=1301 RepID=UPI002559C139|nr:hypothetical protein [Streptococcus sp. SC1]MDL2433017.1 hypothetical protein [Streptococcus sp. SC1]
MNQKLTKQIQEINSNIDLLGAISFFVANIAVLAKIHGHFDCAKFILLILQIVATFWLLYIIFNILPKYHDENKDKADGKGQYGKSVFLFSRINLVKLLERLISVVTADILLFISEKETFTDLWKTILFWLISADLVIWFILKFMNLDNQKFVCVKYCFICLLLTLMLGNLYIPAFLFINTIKNYYMIGALAFAFIYIFYLFSKKSKKQ